MSNKDELQVVPCCYNCENKGNRGLSNDTNYACLDCKNECNFKLKEFKWNPITK